MIKKLFFLIIPFIGFSQVQIGADINGEAIDDKFGNTICLSSNGSVVAIGANGTDINGIDAGSVRILENISGTWTQIGDDINGDTASDSIGLSVSLSSDGTIIAIGFYNGVGAGYVKVFENISGVWTQIGATINGETIGDKFGYSVSLSDDGSILAVGATRNDDGGSNSGHVKVFENISGTWTQKGATINGVAAGDQSGYSVELSNNGLILATGANGNDNGCNNCGQVRVFEYNSSSNLWDQIGSDIYGVAENNFVGIRISLSGDGSIIAIPAHLNDVNGADSGHVRVFENIGGVWTQIGSDINGENAGDYFGNRVSLSNDGTILAVSANYNDDNGNNSGYVRVFKNITNVWTQVGSTINGDSADDYFGYLNLSSDGTILAVGATGDDGNATDSGKVRVYNISSYTLSSESFVSDNFNIYPNPTSQFLTIELKSNSELKKVIIYNYFGQLISEEYNNKIDLSKYSKGIYFLEIATNNGTVTKKIIVE